jgi:hypothetical protein
MSAGGLRAHSPSKTGVNALVGANPRYELTACRRSPEISEVLSPTNRKWVSHPTLLMAQPRFT